MAVHLSRPRHRQRQSSGHPGRHADQLRADLRRRHEQLLRAAARQPDLHHGGNDDASSAAGGSIPEPIRDSRRSSAAMALPTCASTSMRCPARILRNGWRPRARPARRSTRKLTPIWPSRARRSRLSPIAPSPPICFNDIVMPEMSMNDPILRICSASSEGRTMNLLGKLDWSAIPFDQPIVMGATAGMVLAIVARPVVDHAQGTFALSVARVDHLRRPQAHRRHVHRAGAGHAAARLRRRDHDALAAGHRGRRRARISAAGAFRSGLLGPRHHHDLLHGDAVRDRPDELRRAAAARRARHGLSDVELGGPGADRVGHPSDQHLAGGRRVRQRPAGSPIRRSASCSSRPASASTTISGRCRSPASAR